MALRPLNTNDRPLGQFDGLDSEYLTLLGGEVVTFKSVVRTPATDEAASDAFDGYVDPSSVQKRPAVTKTLVGTSRPLMLADEGITGYGTLFGVVVGGIAGQTAFGPNSTVPTAAKLGPHTAAGSGKVTCWAQPGLYAVSLDAVDTTASTGLLPTNTTLDVGSAVSYTAAGLLTPNVGGSKVSGAPVVGTLVEFATNGSLVTTTNAMVSALNSPSGPVSSAALGSFQFAVVWFAPPVS